MGCFSKWLVSDSTKLPQEFYTHREITFVETTFDMAKKYTAECPILCFHSIFSLLFLVAGGILNYDSLIRPNESLFIFYHPLQNSSEFQFPDSLRHPDLSHETISSGVLFGVIVVLPFVICHAASWFIDYRFYYRDRYNWMQFVIGILAYVEGLAFVLILTWFMKTLSGRPRPFFESAF